MLRNLGILSIVLCTSQLLVMVTGVIDKPAIELIPDKTPLASRSKEGASLDCGVRPSPEVKNKYVHFPGLGYYKFHTERQTWNQARKTCFGEGAHLAILNSQREAQELAILLNETLGKEPSFLGENMAWLGVHDLFEKGDWTTVLGDPLKSTNTSDLIRSGWNTYSCAGIWGKQPDYKGGQRNCATLIRQCATMDDIDCYINKMTFICEKPVPCPQVLSN